MLTTQLLSYYNHLLAASIMYLTLVEPLKDIANTLNSHMGGTLDHAGNIAFADSSPEPNYYETLGVKKDATKQEIHRAFRQLAKKYHPDKNKDKSASDEFIKIFKAYETLSDEKKRKEYDDRANGYHHGTNSWASSNMDDFDIHDFFKHYEEQFMRHAQYHQEHPDDYHHHNHHHHHHNHYHSGHQQAHEEFKFHGINLDDLFHDIDEDEFSSLHRVFSAPSHNHLDPSLDGQFGDGASFFGSHFSSQLHDSIQQYEHQNIYGNNQGRSYTCEKIKRNVGGMVMEQTSCS